jgi:hypothetical protein
LEERLGGARENSPPAERIWRTPQMRPVARTASRGGELPGLPGARQGSASMTNTTLSSQAEEVWSLSLVYLCNDPSTLNMQIRFHCRPSDRMESELRRLFDADRLKELVERFHVEVQEPRDRLRVLESHACEG